MSVVVIAQGDDWEGLYVAGTLMAEGHQLDMLETFKVVLNTMPNIIANDISRRSVKFDWLEDRGTLPSNIVDVEWEDAY
jgi:hypothetical protein